jgi:hypothetical protein
VSVSNKSTFLLENLSKEKNKKNVTLDVKEPTRPNFHFKTLSATEKRESSERKTEGNIDPSELMKTKPSRGLEGHLQSSPKKARNVDDMG